MLFFLVGGVGVGVGVGVVVLCFFVFLLIAVCFLFVAPRLLLSAFGLLLCASCL